MGPISAASLLVGGTERQWLPKYVTKYYFNNFVVLFCLMNPLFWYVLNVLITTLNINFQIRKGTIQIDKFIIIVSCMKLKPVYEGKKFTLRFVEYVVYYL